MQIFGKIVQITANDIVELPSPLLGDIFVIGVKS
jgi:hypothetical protein